ncbi:ABC transporter permease [bacterium]|nr:ABC transporter permease [bacterium]
MSLNLLYSLREGVLAMRRSRLSTLWTTSTIAVALTLFGIFMVLTFNLQRMIDSVRQHVVLEAFVDASLGEDAVEPIRATIAGLDGVSEAVFISREQALARFRDAFGDDPMLVLDENPLPMSIEVQVDAAQRTGAQIEGIARRISGIECIDEVAYKGGVVEIINHWSRYIYLIDAVLFFLVLASALFLVSNTLRLTIMAQKKAIQIMQLVGAERGFIRRPYLIQGIFQGALGGGIASCVVWIVFALISLRLPALFELPSWLLLTPMGLGALLAFWGSEISVNRFLNDV